MLRGWLHVNERLQHAADCGKYAAEGENAGAAKRAHRNRPHRTPRAAEYRRKLNTAALPNSGLEAPSTGHWTRQERTMGHRAGRERGRMKRTRGQGLPGIFCGHKWR